MFISGPPSQTAGVPARLLGVLACLLAAAFLAAAVAPAAPAAPSSAKAKAKRHPRCARSAAGKRTAQRNGKRRRVCRPTVSFTVAGRAPEPPPGREAEDSTAPLSKAPGAAPGGLPPGDQLGGEAEAELEVPLLPEAEEPGETETSPPADGEESEPAPPESPAPGQRRTPFFSPDSFWNAELAPDAALDPLSAPMMQSFDAEVEAELAAERGPSINTSKWSVPLYVVPGDQPTSKVTLSRSGYPALQAAFDRVPLPDNVQAAGGTDKHLVVYQPSSDRLWEFWRFEGEPGFHRAGWGGAMERVSSSAGVYSAAAWPGATSGWGGSATSLPLVGGLVTLEDLERGEIDHALALAIPDVRGDFYSLPARRGDGFSSDPLALPEGARLRLDPGLNLAALHLPWFTRLLAEAAQRYGIVVRSKAAVIDFYGQDPTPTGTNPYGGANGYFKGINRLDLMAAFPWQSLQLLEMQPRPYR